VRKGSYSRRDVLELSTTYVVSAAFAEHVKVAAAEPSSVTSTLIEAARKEGKVVWYSRERLALLPPLRTAIGIRNDGLPGKGRGSRDVVRAVFRNHHTRADIRTGHRSLHYMDLIPSRFRNVHSGHLKSK
jgi:hypothetical protein